MMQNSNHSSWVEEVTLASDLWSREKYMPPKPVREELREWGRACAILGDLLDLAETLQNERLELALSDAFGRASEEFERLQDRAERLSVGDADDLLPREQERLRVMLRRSDALSMARTLMEEAGGKAEEVDILKSMSQEASEAFDRYKAEVGIDS
jgi:hypothetical protein